MYVLLIAKAPYVQHHGRRSVFVTNSNIRIQRWYLTAIGNDHIVVAFKYMEAP